MGRALLLLVSGLVIIFGLIEKSILDRQRVIPEVAVDYHSQQQARSIGTGLAEFAIAEIEANQSWSPPDTFANFMNGAADVTLYEENDFLNYPDSLPEDNSVPSWDEYTMLIFVESYYGNVKSEVEVLLRKDSFSKYIYFTNTEPSNIYFFSDDVLNGPVHTNGTFNIAGDPQFNGRVTSPNEWSGHPHYENDPQFLGGFDFNAEPSLPPTSYELQYLRDAANSGGLSFNEPIDIEFKNDGTADIKRWNGSGWGEPSNYDLSGYNGLISSSADVQVKGTVKGQYTIHSESNIEIMGDIRYATNPQTDSTSNDILGMVSEGNVMVDQNAHLNEGTQDIDIHASIMALDRSFSVENWESGDPRGTINLLGGVIQDRRGAVGSFNSNGIASGFSKQYEYDQRLREKMVPPYFPRESVFSKIYWKDKQYKYTNSY